MMSAKNKGVHCPDPPFPLVSQQLEIGLPPAPCQKNSIIGHSLTTPPQLVTNIFGCPPIRFFRHLFQEESFNFEIILACVIYDRENSLDKKKWQHLSHSEKKGKYFANSASLFRLSQKDQNMSNPYPPL